MRPMTAREALGHTRDLYRRLSSMDTREAVKLEHADALLDALVELREATRLRHAGPPLGVQCGSETAEWRRGAVRRVDAAEHKLAALERGEEPKE